MRKLFVLLTMLTLALGAAGTASASTIKWNLFDVKFETGNPVIDTATATGFFSVDSDTLDVVDFDILVSGGTLSLANGGLADANHHYVSAIDVVYKITSTWFYFCTSDCFGSEVNLQLVLASDISAGPGTIALTNSTLDCPRCGVLGASDASITTNDVSAAPVPEPASMLLLGTGLAAGAARLRRRKK